MSFLDQAKRFPWRHEAVLLLLVVLLLVVASSLQPGFLKLRSQLLLSRHLWEFAILALGMTLVIITGGIDLSIGSNMGLSAVAFGICYSTTGDPLVSSLVALATGTAGGATNGLLISKVNVHPLIVTLATYAAFRGIAEGVSQGASYSQFGEAFSRLARGQWLGVPLPGYIFVCLAIGFAIFLWKTPTGRFLYAIGHNEQAARFSGIAVDRIKLSLYTMSGTLAGLASVIYVSRFDTAKADAGQGFELDVITAVVVGGTSIFGGRGNIVGTVLGLVLIHETRQFVGRYWRMDELRSIVIGFLLIASVLVYRMVRKRDRD
ncbi:MAG: ABC transporter permease [Planctomycetaceae bacterium]|nr:ABC transporter permease [Planctomycetaceae bacterium]